jgi:RNA polymerase sigma-70 factor (ECF subfamily)
VTAIELRPEGIAQTARLFEAHGPRVLAYCQRRLGSRPEAEDAAQTVFLYAHRALHRGVVPESEEAWLLAIAKNICRWQQRTASRRGLAPAELDLDVIPIRRDDQGALEIHKELQEALATVPERQRQALLLREWRGLSCPEIAEVLELSPPATHALLTRARRSVARALSAAGRRPVLGLDLPELASQLRALLAGSAAKTAVAAVAVAGLGVGGVALERAVGTHDPTPKRAITASREAGPSAVSPATRAHRGIVPTAVPAWAQGRDIVGATAEPGSAAEPTTGGDSEAEAPRSDPQPPSSEPLPPKVDDPPGAATTPDPTSTETQPQLTIEVPPPPSLDPGSVVDLATVLVPPLSDPTVPAVDVPTVQVETVSVPDPVAGLLP